MVIGAGTQILVAVFAVAALLVVFWRVVLTVLAVGVLGMLLLGAVQVVHEIQGLL